MNKYNIEFLMSLLKGLLMRLLGGLLMKILIRLLQGLFMRFLEKLFLRFKLYIVAVMPPSQPEELGWRIWQHM